MERFQSEAQETKGDEGDMALSRAVCYLRTMFVFTFTAAIQSRNRPGSDQTAVFWRLHTVVMQVIFLCIKLAKEKT